MTRRAVMFAKVLIWGVCLAPLGLLLIRGFGIGGPSLGANPVEEVLNVCGKTGLNLLMLTLCITPIRRSTGFNRLIAFRRLLGLFAFFYLVLHFLTYALLDLGLAWETLLADIAERPYITVGFTALVLLIPLAATSTQAMQRRLGRNWARLHKLIYLIAALGLVHYWWQVKSKADVAEPLLYALLLTVLLGVRLHHWRDIQRKRARSVDAKTTMAPTYQRVEPP
jgi:methionine sulfoxide reductase heme-binding subunit